MPKPKTTSDMSRIAAPNQSIDWDNIVNKVREATGEDLDGAGAKTLIEALKFAPPDGLSQENKVWREKVLKETSGLTKAGDIRTVILSNSSRANVVNAVKAKAASVKEAEAPLFTGAQETGKRVRSKKTEKVKPTPAAPINKPGPTFAQPAETAVSPTPSPKPPVVPQNPVVAQSPVSPALSSFVKTTKSGGIYSGIGSESDLAQLASLTGSERKTYAEFVRGGMEQSKALGVVKQMSQQRLAAEAEKAAAKTTKIGGGNIANAKIPNQGFSGPVSPYLERRFRKEGLVPGPTRRTPSVLNPANTRLQVGNVRLGSAVAPPKVGLLDATGPIDPLASLTDVNTTPPVARGLDSALSKELAPKPFRAERLAKAEALAARKGLLPKVLKGAGKALGVVGAVMTAAEVLDALSSDPREKAAQELAGETEAFGQAARSSAVDAALTSEEKALSGLVGMAEADVYGQRMAAAERQAQVLELVGPDLMKLQQAATPTRPSFSEMMLKMGVMQ